MLKKFIHSKIRTHHPWREMKFDELAEMYTSMGLRSFGFSLVGVFVPIYLYQHGVSLQSIFLFFAIFFALRIPSAFIAAYVIGRIGPKHTIAISTLLIIVFFMMLLSYSTVVWPLFMLAAVWTFSNGLFFIAFHVDFSKIKHRSHGGKELGWVFIFEQAGRTLGPVIGGLVAGIFFPEVTLILAIIALSLSLVPLFMTREQIKVHQHITFKGFTLRDKKRDFISISALNIVFISGKVLWPLLIAITVFQDNTYEKLGLVIGLTAAISVFTTHMYGRFIDSQRGRQLLFYGTVMNVVMMNSMAITTSVGGAVGVSALGEPVLQSYRMPLFKGMYDAADADEKFRIVYIVWHEFFASAAKVLLYIGLYVAASHADSLLVLRYGLVAASIIGIAMLMQDFPALKTKR